jgi:hypothetical protein
LGRRGPAGAQIGKHFANRIQGVLLLIGIVVFGRDITLIPFIAAFDCQPQILPDGIVDIRYAGMMTEDAAERAVRNAWPVAEDTAGIRAVEEWMETVPVRMKTTAESVRMKITAKSVRTGIAWRGPYCDPGYDHGAATNLASMRLLHALICNRSSDLVA